MKLRQIIEAQYHPNTYYTEEDDQDFEDVISPQDLNGWEFVHQPLVVYKATNTPGKEIPGFTTTDLEEAQMYLGGSDWGGPYLVKIDVDPKLNKPIQQDMFLDGRDGPVKFEAGVRSIMKRGSEVVILVPVQQKIINVSI